MALKMLSGSKTITTIQEGSVYKERWVCNPSDPWPDGSTARQEFLDSSGAVIAELVADTVDSRYITFRSPYADVENVPNGAGFRCYLSDPADTMGEHMVRYGSVFRRQNFFPHSPAQMRTYEPKRFTDTFQRPAGQLGGKWVNLLGRPKIKDNAGSDPNSVGPDFPFLSRYFTRYYVPFNGDSIELSLSAIDKGDGNTMVAMSCSSDGSSFIYAMFDSEGFFESLFGTGDKVHLGIGHGTDMHNIANFEPQTSAVDFAVADHAPVTNFKLRYDEATKEFAFYNDDYTTKYLSWVDTDDQVPHGKGYRYFAIGGSSSLLNTGVEITYISAANIV